MIIYSTISRGPTHLYKRSYPQHFPILKAYIFLLLHLEISPKKTTIHSQTHSLSNNNNEIPDTISLQLSKTTSPKLNLVLFSRLTSTYQQNPELTNQRWHLDQHPYWNLHSSSYLTLLHKPIIYSLLIAKKRLAVAIGEGTHPVSAVIFDLDGTLLDADSLVEEVVEGVVTSYGKDWDSARGAQKRLGRRPLEAAACVVEEYDLPCTPEALNAQVIALLQDRWQRAKPLPGAIRLVKYLHSHSIPVAIASSSPAQIIKTKLSLQSGWTDYFPVVVAGDMVQNGKPAPDIFIEAARRLNADASKCLVVEDAPAGVEAGKAAGMQVVAVPSLPSKDARPLYSTADVIYSSLLDFEPHLWGLPPLNDRVGGVLPLEPWYMGGPVIKGFGRGSKVLGIPTGMLVFLHCKQTHIVATSNAKC